MRQQMREIVTRTYAVSARRRVLIFDEDVEGRRVIGYLIRYNLRTPFIVLAQCTDAAWYEQALALGAIDYLKKPVTPEELNWIIQRFLGLRNSLAK